MSGIEANMFTDTQDSEAISDSNDPDEPIEPNVVKENIINYIGGFIVRKIKN